MYSDKKYTSNNDSYIENALSQNLSAGSYANQKISYPVFKPLTYAYSVISAGDAYTIAQEIDGKDAGGNTITKASNFYGLNPVQADSHMMKNSEWGAVVYLTQSKYGRNRIEVLPNTKNLYLYTKGINSITAYEYQTPLGVGASTTNNKTGIFDLSGCINEFTAGYINNSRGTWNRNTYMQSFGTQINSTKYATIYPYSFYDNMGENYREYGKNALTRYGDAILETSGSDGRDRSWFDDSLYYPNNADTIFLRGGDNSPNPNGIFSFTSYDGEAWDSMSFRVTLLAV